MRSPLRSPYASNERQRFRAPNTPPSQRRQTTQYTRIVYFAALEKLQRIKRTRTIENEISSCAHCRLEHCECVWAQRGGAAAVRCIRLCVAPRNAHCVIAAAPTAAVPHRLSINTNSCSVNTHSHSYWLALPLLSALSFSHALSFSDLSLHCVLWSYTNCLELFASLWVQKLLSGLVRSLCGAVNILMVHYSRLSTLYG